MRKIKLFCFSPCGKTAIVAETVANRMALRLGLEVVRAYYTTPVQRANIVGIEPDDVIIWATPVYAGKTPNVMLKFVKNYLQGKNNPVILIATFGNRSFDNAIAEMVSVVRDGGMRSVAAAAVVAEHAFASELGFGRPSPADFHEIELFADAINPDEEITDVPGYPDANYYQPLREDGTPANFLKALPMVDQSKCTACALCVSVCPVGSITVNEIACFHSPCIKCMACIKECPNGALTIDHPDFISHRNMLLSNMSSPKKNTFWVGE